MSGSPHLALQDAVDHALRHSEVLDKAAELDLCGPPVLQLGAHGLGLDLHRQIREKTAWC